MAPNRAKLSGCSFCHTLGDISPKISTNIVMTTVESGAPAWGKYFVNKIVAIEAAAMF